MPLPSAQRVEYQRRLSNPPVHGCDRAWCITCRRLREAKQALVQPELPGVHGDLVVPSQLYSCSHCLGAGCGRCGK